jgi:hypothetical protein
MKLPRLDLMRQLGRHKPRRQGQRRFAEHCQYGDAVEWREFPFVRRGYLVERAPSTTGVIAFFLGPAPFTAFVRFLTPFGYTEPLQVLRDQPLRVTHPRP